MVDKIWYNMEELVGGSEERVLIETYWNVKKQFAEMSENRVEVLIETYWNVKLGTTAAMSLTSDSINRNILECKGASGQEKTARIRVY